MNNALFSKYGKSELITSMEPFSHSEIIQMLQGNHVISNNCVCSIDNGEFKMTHIAFAPYCDIDRVYLDCLETTLFDMYVILKGKIICEDIKEIIKLPHDHLEN